MPTHDASERNSSFFGEDVPTAGDQATPVRTTGQGAAENRGKQPPEGSGAVVGSGAGAGGGGAEDQDTDVQAGSRNAAGMNGVG